MQDIKKVGPYVPSERICRIGDATPKRWQFKHDSCQKHLNLHKAFFDIYSDLPLWERQARSFAYAIVNEPVYMFEDEHIIGTVYNPSDPWMGYVPTPSWEGFSVIEAQREIEARELPDLHAIYTSGDNSTLIITEGAFPGHIGWRWDWVLEHGVEGLLARHREALAAAKDEKSRQYYQGVLIVLEGVLGWNQKHIEAMEARLANAQGQRREELQKLIDTCRQVPAKPARNFREALQSYHFMWTACMYESPYGGNSPGRLDYLLWPYMEQEYQAGTLDYQQAADLLAEVLIKCDERVHPHDGHVNAAVIGGTDREGADAVNPLSYILMDVIERLSLTHPSIYVRLSEKNPPEFQDRCVRYLLDGGNRAQVMCEEPILKAMTRDNAMPLSDASMYMAGGCMELSPQGMNSDLLWAFFYNAPKTLELLLTGGDDLLTGRQRLTMGQSLKDFGDFESLYKALEEQFSRVLTQKFRALDICSEQLARLRPQYLLSSMIDDCLERGREQQDGGARYHDYGGAVLGLPNVADSLYAIRRAIFEEKFCSPQTLLDALKNDFEGHEALRHRLMSLPKYGQGDQQADEMMSRVLKSISHIFDSYRNRFGGRVKHVMLTFTFSAQCGLSLGASPDGRKKGKPLAHGLTPQSSSMDKGITAAINSYGSLDNTLVSGGASTMWDIDSRWASPTVVKSVLLSFLQKGGQIFQGNTTSVEELQQAIIDPVGKENIIVRVGGFSARFIWLSREVQEEIVTRRRHQA